MRKTGSLKMHMGPQISNLELQNSTKKMKWKRIMMRNQKRSKTRKKEKKKWRRKKRNQKKTKRKKESPRSIQEA